VLRFGDRRVHSSQDLVSFVRCGRLGALRRAGIQPSASTAATGPPDDDLGSVLIERGHEHEAAVLGRFRAEGLRVEAVTVGRLGEAEVLAASERTSVLLREGVDVIHQAVLYDGTWVGLADFLLRVEVPSDLGPFSYEVSDAKLTRHVKPEAVLQASLYSVLLEPVQGHMPCDLHLEHGGGAARTTRPTARTAAYTRRLMRRYLDDVEQDDGAIRGLDGTGVRFVSVDHQGNRSSAREEVAVVAHLADGLLAGTFVDGAGTAKAIGYGDLAISTPFNAQVARLRRALPEAVGVGTVDRFQGSQAPVVIVSLASSSPEDAPRGLPPDGDHPARHLSGVAAPVRP